MARPKKEQVILPPASNPAEQTRRELVMSTYEALIKDPDTEPKVRLEATNALADCLGMRKGGAAAGGADVTNIDGYLSMQSK